LSLATQQEKCLRCC